MPDVAEDKLRMGDEDSLTKGKPDSSKVITLDPSKFNTLWRLHYKAVHNVGETVFKGPEEKESAINLGYIFCSKRNWKFIQVRPFLTDIMSDPQTEEERLKYSSPIREVK